MKPHGLAGRRSCVGGNWVDCFVSCAMWWSIFALLCFGLFLLASVLGIRYAGFLPIGRYLARNHPLTLTT